MSREYKVYLEDILASIEKIEKYTANLSFQTLSVDEKTLDAVIRNLEVISEAAKQISVPIRSANPEVEWARIAGLRDILIHQYFGIDLAIVWDVVKNKLPTLALQIRQILASSDRSS